MPSKKQKAGAQFHPLSHSVCLSQERKLRQSGDNWKRSFFLPASADAGVIAFRTWFSELAGGAVDWAPGTPTDLGPVLPREEVIDRYHSHTKNCTHCSKALKALQLFETASKVLCAAFLGAFICTLGPWAPSGGPPKGLLGALPAIISGLFAAAAAWSRMFQRKFGFSDYVHAYSK